MADIGVFLI